MHTQIAPNKGPVSCAGGAGPRPRKRVDKTRRSAIGGGAARLAAGADQRRLDGRAGIQCSVKLTAHLGAKQSLLPISADLFMSAAVSNFHSNEMLVNDSNQ